MQVAPGMVRSTQAAKASISVSLKLGIPEGSGVASLSGRQPGNYADTSPPTATIQRRIRRSATCPLRLCFVRLQAQHISLAKLRRKQWPLSRLLELFC